MSGPSTLGCGKGGLVWEVTGTSNAVTLMDVYADSAREALEKYLEQGGLASLSMRMKAVL